jgi:hypothetical protein
MIMDDPQPSYPPYPPFPPPPDAQSSSYPPPPDAQNPWAQQQPYGQPYPGQYGQPQQYYYYPPPPQRPGNGLGVAGFVLGLLGLVFFFIPFFGGIMSLLGVVLGGAGISSGKKRGAGIGLAVTGLVLGLVAMIPAVLFLIAMFSAGAALH